MLILAFETSAKAASAALLEDGKLLAESYQNTGLTHSQTLMVMAENLLHQCGKTVNDVNAVAVAAGPGSFPVCASASPPQRVSHGAGKCPATASARWKPLRFPWANIRATYVP